MRSPSLIAAVALFGAACSAPPTSPVVAIEPAEPTTVDQLEAVFTTPATDDNDDPLTYTYVWSVD